MTKFACLLGFGPATLFITGFDEESGMRTNPRNPPVYARFPSNAPTACSVYVAIDVVRIARLGFGGVRLQRIEIK